MWPNANGNCFIFLLIEFVFLVSSVGNICGVMSISCNAAIQSVPLTTWNCAKA